MDNISHTLVGAAIGEAGLKRYTGLGMATLMIAANLPDLDVLAIPLGQNLTFRRGWTHGPLAVFVLPALLTLCVVGFDRFQHRRGTRPKARATVRPNAVFVLSLVGFLTHPFLDWLNNYGIRLLMPFSHEWFYGDALFIVDPWLWLLMGTGIFLSRRRAQRGHSHPRRPAILTVGMLVLYISLMITGSRVGTNVAAEALAQEGLPTAERIMAGPVPVNPNGRALVFDMGASYRFGELRLLPSPEVRLEPDPLPTNHDHPVVARAVESGAFDDFLYWSRFPFFSVSENGSRYLVEVGDARFARRPGGGFATSRTIVDADGL